MLKLLPLKFRNLSSRSSPLHPPLHSCLTILALSVSISTGRENVGPTPSVGKSGLSLPSWFAGQRGSDGGRHAGSSPQSSPGPWAPAQHATVHPSCYLSPTQNSVRGDEPSQQPERALCSGEVPASHTDTRPWPLPAVDSTPESISLQIHKCLSLGI